MPTAVMMITLSRTLNHSIWALLLSLSLFCHQDMDLDMEKEEQDAPKTVATLLDSDVLLLDQQKVELN